MRKPIRPTLLLLAGFSTSLAATLLAGCATGASQQQTQAVAVLESGLTAADILALQYTSQPPCPALPTCATPAVKTQIKAAALVAYNAVKSAEASAASGATVDTTAATAALAALQSLVTEHVITTK